VKDVPPRGLVSLAYALEREDASWQLFSTPFSQGAQSRRLDLLDGHVCAAVQLFNGETSYGDADRMERIKWMLVELDAKYGARDWVNMRGMGHTFAYSQLDDIVGHRVTAEDHLPLSAASLFSPSPSPFAASPLSPSPSPSPFAAPLLLAAHEPE
jgi:hypothetical protein